MRFALILATLLMTSTCAFAQEELPVDEAGEGPLGIPIEEVPTFDDLSGDRSDVVDEPQAEEPPPPVLRDVSVLPEPVRRTRELLLDAARSGDIKRLAALVGRGPTQTQLSTAETPEDPEAFLRAASGDPEGHEVMAILAEVLEAGFVHLDEGQDSEIYVWPYFAALPIGNLTPQQKVELFRIITGGDYEEMVEFGAYVFYRLGIAPDGSWRFFVAGD